MKKIIAIIGARPQFIKHAPVEIELQNSFLLKSIHTGQHYDDRMSKVFFDELNMRQPDYTLHIGSGDHSLQTGKMLIELEPILKNEQPDAILVYGDTNTTLAGALVAAKLHIPVIHVEAGLRSYNRQMPEEINRVMTDHLSTILICPTKIAVENLKKEGIVKGVFETGDVMKDMIRIAFEKNIIQKNIDDSPYYFATIHRPYNTDDKERLGSIVSTLNGLDTLVKFSVHPRTYSRLNEWYDIHNEFKNIEFLPPVSYFESLNLQYNAKTVITDSGGIQKEAYLLKKKCITIRSETEWTETLEGGWNTLIFNDLTFIKAALQTIPEHYNNNAYGDGKGSEAFRLIIEKFLSENNS